MNKIRKAGRAGTANKGRLSDKAFGAIIIILAIILVIMLMALGAKIKYSHEVYISDPDSVLYTIKNGRFQDALEDKIYNETAGATVEKDKDYEIPYALVDYYEAESYYTAYSKAAENTADPAEKARLEDRAASFREKMEAAAGSLGDLAFMTEDIDAVFN